jgi:tetratricopeptide (TPR) repeat protein
LGILAIQQEQKQAARRHFALAVQRHTKSAEILYRYASLEMEAGTASDSVSALLKRALQLKPDYDAARLELGLIDYTDDDFEAAIPLLSSLNALSLDAEYQVYYTLAECFLNLEKDPESRQYADKASQAAKSPEEKRKLSVLLVKLRSDETAVARSSGVDAPVIPSITQSSVVNVRGHTRELLCSGGQKRLLIDVQGHDLILDISDPQLVVRHPSPDFSAWQCGPLTAEELTVVYTPQAGPGGTTQKVDGKAVELIF